MSDYCPMCGFRNQQRCGDAEVTDNQKNIFQKQVQGTIKPIATWGKPHYCPSCGVNNPAWVRQKKMPLKCRSYKSEWTLSNSPPPTPPDPTKED